MGEEAGDGGEGGEADQVETDFMTYEDEGECKARDTWDFRMPCSLTRMGNEPCVCGCVYLGHH